jgi:hypothetical protein
MTQDKIGRAVNYRHHRIRYFVAIWRKCSPKRLLVSIYSARLYRDLAAQKSIWLANKRSCGTLVPEG